MRITATCGDLRRLAATGDEILGGKKELTGRTDLDGETSNQCARLIANASVFYNSAILSRPLTRYAATGNRQRGSAGAHHVDITGGHYTFCGGQPIDLDALIGGLDLR